MLRTFKADDVRSTNQYIFGRSGLNFGTGIGIDFNKPIVQTVVITGDYVKVTGVLNPSLSSRELKASTVRFVNEYTGASARLDFVPNIRFLGGVPTGIKSGKIGIVSFNSFGPSVNDTVAVYRSEGKEELFGLDEGSVLFVKDGTISGHNQFTWDPTGLLKVSGNIVPAVSGIFDLGTNELRWKDIYLEGTTIHLGDREISYSGGNFKFGSDFIVLSPTSSSVSGLSGTIGPSGATGPSGHSVTGAIGTGVGANGGTSGVIFRFSNGSNSNVISLPIGPSGAQGAQGPSGVQGSSGAQGPTGPAGGGGGPIDLSGIYNGAILFDKNDSVSGSSELTWTYNNTTGTLNISGHIVPQFSGVYDLGSNVKYWDEIFVDEINLPGRVINISNVVTADNISGFFPSGTGIGFNNASYIANGSQTTYSTSGIIENIENILVSIDGLMQRPHTDFTISSNNIVFSAAPAADSILLIKNLKGTSFSSSVGGSACVGNTYDLCDEVTITLMGSSFN